MNSEKQPLVTVAVVTYNSGNFVLETLDSVKNQTYKNIELIISDDCSSDNTVELCHNWIDVNGDLFVRCELVTIDKNTGVSANSNRALVKASGLFYKVLDGDDILMPNALMDYVDYFIKHTEVRLAVAPSIHFVETFDPNNIGKPDVISRFLYRDKMTASKQSKVISKMFFGSGPTCFTYREDIINIGGFDERFPLCEDYPLLINLIYYGDKMHLMDRPTVYKRIRSTSIQYEKNKGAVFGSAALQGYIQHGYAFRRERHNMIWRRLHDFSLWLNRLIVKSGNNMNCPKCRFYVNVRNLLDPYIVYGKLKRFEIKLYDYFVQR